MTDSAPDPRKGKNIGLDPKERRRWVSGCIKEILETHGVLEPMPASVSIDLYPLLCRGDVSPGLVDAVLGPERAAKANALREAGMRDVVEFIYQKVFTKESDLDEKLAMEKWLLPYPKEAPLVVRAVKPFAEAGKPMEAWARRFEALDAAFAEPRRRKVNVWLTPFLQDSASGQPGLGAFIRAKMHGSSPQAVSAMVRMRKYALSKSALGDFVRDEPGDIARFYMNNILDDLRADSLPVPLYETAVCLLGHGEDPAEIMEIIRKMSSYDDGQTIRPGIRDIMGLRFEILHKHDSRVMSAGDINGSCFTWGGAAGSGVRDVVMNPRSALAVVRLPPENDLVPLENAADLLEKAFNDRRTLEQKGYLAYLYLLHANSGIPCADNVEANGSGMADQRFGPAVAEFMRQVAKECGSGFALVGKMGSPASMFEGMPEVEDSFLPEGFMAREFPDRENKIYTDLNKSGVWKISVLPPA